MRKRTDVLSLALGDDYTRIVNTMDGIAATETKTAMDAVRKSGSSARVRPISRSDVGRRLLLKALGLKEA